MNKKSSFKVVVVFSFIIVLLILIIAGLISNTVASSCYIDVNPQGVETIYYDGHIYQKINEENKYQFDDVYINYEDYRIRGIENIDSRSIIVKEVNNGRWLTAFFPQRIRVIYKTENSIEPYLLYMDDYLETIYYARIR